MNLTNQPVYVFGHPIPPGTLPLFLTFLAIGVLCCYIQLKAIRWNLPFYMAAWMLWRDMLVTLRIRKN